MRSLRKEWKDRKSGYRRRARWYDDGQRSYRLNLEDEYYEVNRWFTDEEEAQKLWDAFVRVGNSDMPAIIDGELMSCVKLACKVAGVKVPGFEEHKTLDETLADYERTPEFARAYEWLTLHTPGARLPEELEQ